MTDLRVEVWDPPGIATFERRIAGIKGLAGVNGTVYRRQIGQGSMVIPANYDRLDEVIRCDPDDHTNDVASLVRVYRDTDLVQEWLVDQTPNVTSESPVSVAGKDVAAVMDWAVVEPWDWDGSVDWVSRFPDWIYDGRNILVDPTFTSPVCEPRISEFWTDATSGNWTATVNGSTTAGIAFNASATDVENAYEALATVTDVLVEGSGNPDDPWRVTFVDPCFPTTYSVSDGTLNQPLEATLIQTGSLQPAGWTRSQTVGVGVPITFGEYTTFEVATPPSAPPCGGDAIHVVGTTPYQFNYPGAQTTPNVTPGGLYQAGVWVYPVGTNQDFRLVIRPVTEEPLIASSTWPSTTLTAGMWSFLPITNITMPDVTEVIFRVAAIEPSGANFWVACPELKEGLPPANAGEIMIDLLDDAQTDHAPGRETITFIKPSFDVTNDTSGTPWPADLSIDIPRGMTYRKVLEAKFGGLGYEWAVRPDLLVPGEWWLDLWAPGTRVDDVTAALTPSLLTGQGTLGSYATQQVPRANRILAEGAGFYTTRVENTDSQATIGVREGYTADVTYIGDLTDTFAAETLAKFLDQSLAPRFDIADQDTHPVPLVDYGLATRLNVDLANGSGKIARDVEAVSYRQDDGLVWTVHTGMAQFDQPTLVLNRYPGGDDVGVPIGAVNPISTPRPPVGIVDPIQPGQNVGASVGVMGPTIEGTRWLLDNFERLQPQTRPSTFLPQGGGGAPTVVVACANSTDLEKSKADYLLTGSFAGDDPILREAALQAGTGRLIVCSGDAYLNHANGPLEIEGMLIGVGKWGTRIDTGTTNPTVGNDPIIQLRGFMGVVRDIAIFGTGAANDPAGIQIDDQGCLVDNCYISVTGHGVIVAQEREAVIIDNFIVADGDGINVVGASNQLRIISNYVSCSGNSVYVTGSQTQNGLISGNYLLGFAVFLEDVLHFNVSDNKILGNGNGVELVDVSAVVVDGNLMDSLGLNGVLVTRGGVVTVSNNFIREAEANGVAADGTNFLQVRGNQILSPNFNAEGAAGILYDGTNYTSGPSAIIEGNMVQSASGCPGILVDSAVLVKVANNIVEYPGEHGISIVDSSQCMVTDNQISGFGGAPTDTFDGINLSGDSNENQIVGNYINEPAVSNVYQYALNVSASTCDDNVYVGNRAVGGFGTGDYNDSGTGTVNTWPAAGGAQGDNFT